MKSVTSQDAWRAIALASITILAYMPAIQAGFIWDDDSYVTENRLLRSANGLVRIWSDPSASPQYYPLVFTTFWVECRLWGLQPLGHHLVNVLLHIVSALILWRILADLEAPGAWIAAMVFALHPVHVESVAWITERKNVLSGVLYLASGLCWMSFFGLRRSAGKRWVWCAVGSLLFLGALLSKTVTCTLPAAMALVLWWKRGRVSRAEMVSLLPLFAVGTVFGLLTAWLERHHVGAAGREWSLTFWERSLIAGRALWFYAGKLIFPATLTFNYPRWEIDAGRLWPCVYPAGVLGVVLLLWAFRKRIGRGPLAAVLFFCGTLTPALGFFDVYPFRYSFVADHFQYLASIGLIVLAAATISRALESSRMRSPVLKAALALAAIGVLSCRTWAHAESFRDSETLWRATIRRNPASWLAFSNLGLAMADSGRVEEAISHYQRALVLKPDHWETHNNLGNLLAQTGKLPEALPHYREAIRLRPDGVEPRRNLALALDRMGRHEEARRHYQEALRLKPNDAETLSDFGQFHERAGRTEEAGKLYAAALRMQPDFADGRNNLGRLLFTLGRVEEAIQHYQMAIQSDPDYADAHYNLAIALSRIGALPAAVHHYRQALRIKPNQPEALNNLGLALIKLGASGEAVACFQQAVRIGPNLAEAYVNLGGALAEQGKFEEAASVLRQASLVFPNSPAVHHRLGLVYWMMGDKDAALREHDTLKQLDPAGAAELLQLFEHRTGSGERRTSNIEH